MRRHLGVEHVRVLLLGVHRRHLHVWLLQHLPLPDGHLLRRDWGLGGLGLRVSGSWAVAAASAAAIVTGPLLRVSGSRAAAAAFSAAV